MANTDRTRGWRPGMVVMAIVLTALVAAPVGAVAATQLVKITGPTGTVAGVDGANRLMAAESDPAAYFSRGYFPLATGDCTQMFKAAATKAVIVRQIVVQLKTSGGFDGSHLIQFVVGQDCVGPAVFEFQPATLGTHVFTLEPGRPIPAGQRLTVMPFGSGITAEVQVTGYTVPAASVP